MEKKAESEARASELAKKILRASASPLEIQYAVGQLAPLYEMIEEESSAANEYEHQLARANRIIGWMMPYIGSMCPPSNGLYELNIHCRENVVPNPDDETKGAPIRQRIARQQEPADGWLPDGSWKP